MTALMTIAFTLIAATAAWTSVDDGVMGGRSSSRTVRTGDGTMLFLGEVSLENNGGFASIRSAPQQHDLAGTSGIVLRVRGDGKRYRVNLRTDAGFDGVQYQAAFTTIDGVWQDVDLDFARFEPRLRGRPVPAASPLDPARIVTFGLLIADRQAGRFRLELDTITSRVADRS